MKTLCAFLAGAWLAMPVAAQELHGANDVFATPGVTIAWAILRGATEDSTQVVLRIAVEPKTFTHVGVDGVDPFTRERQALLTGRAITGDTEVRTPRARYADLPRSEVRLFRSAEAWRAGSPALVVYYLSIPDTTPEFATAAALAAYLDGRIANARVR